MSVGIVDKNTGDRIQTAGNPLDKVGDLTNLTTTAKDNAVAAINEVNAGLAGKQNTLTFDSVPTDGSTNPVESNGIYDALALKQDATDSNLQTTADTIVGAINEHEGDIGELKSGLTSVESKIDDATTYPYADVITIENAVPSNLAECSVKIEPVQDLHGYDKPWVGGAGKNKENVTLTTGTYAGVTWTVYDDKRIKISGTVPEGGVTLNTAIADIDTTALAGYKFVYSEDGSGAFYPRIMNSDLSANLQDLQNGTIIADNGSNCKLVYRIPNNTNIDKTISSMIVASTETDLSYAPYENICPISGHTEVDVQRDGKNLIGEFENGGFDSNGLNGLSDKRVRSKYYVSVQEGQTYTFNANMNGGSGNAVASISLYTTDDYTTPRVDAVSFANCPVTFTVPNGIKYVRVLLKNSSDGNVTVSSFKDFQLEKGSTATPYEPYQGKTYTIALGDTIYGGKVRIDSNGNTVMDVDSGILDLGSLAYTYDSQYARFTSYTVSAMKVGEPRTLPLTCECYEVIDDGRPIQNVPDSSIYNRGGSGGVHIQDSRYTDPSDFATALDGMQLVYPLATPFTVQLTPQQIQLLKGQNTLTASTGQISVTVNGVSGSIGQVQEQVNEIAEDVAELQTGRFVDIHTVTADGVKTATELLQELWSYVTTVRKCYIVYNESLFIMSQRNASHAVFSRTINNEGTTYITTIDIMSNNVFYMEVRISSQGTITVDNNSSMVIPSGRKFILAY